MTSVEELKAISDAILPYLAKPPKLASPEEQHAYLAVSLEFAYTAVELVEAQLERNLRAAQEGLADAHTEQEILEMERRLIEEQAKMDNMKAACLADTKRIILLANTNSPVPSSPQPDGQIFDSQGRHKSASRGKVARRLSKIWT